jgi:uncharacterized membrane protein
MGHFYVSKGLLAGRGQTKTFCGQAADVLVGQHRRRLLRRKEEPMKALYKYGGIALAIILIVLGIFFVKDPYSAGQFVSNYFAAGDFASGVFAAGDFSAGIFAAGTFAIGVFSAGIFSVGVFSIGFFSTGLFGLTEPLTLCGQAEAATLNVGPI